MWNDKYNKKEEPKDAPVIIRADKESEEKIKAIVDKLLEGQQNWPMYTDTTPVAVYNPATKEEIEVEDINEALPVIAEGKTAVIDTEEYTAHISLSEEDQEEPVVVQTAPAVVKPAEAQEDASVKTEEAEPTPCPFCGAQVKLTYYKRWHVTGHASHCFLAPNFSVGKTRDQVLAAWNDRSCW